MFGLQNPHVTKHSFLNCSHFFLSFFFSQKSIDSSSFSTPSHSDVGGNVVTFVGGNVVIFVVMFGLQNPHVTKHSFLNCSHFFLSFFFSQKSSDSSSFSTPSHSVIGGNVVIFVGVHSSHVNRQTSLILSSLHLPFFFLCSHFPSFSSVSSQTTFDGVVCEDTEEKEGKCEQRKKNGRCSEDSIKEVCRLTCEECTPANITTLPPTNITTLPPTNITTLPPITECE